MQLDNRAQTLLKALVERYIADGQPVGSRALARISGLDLSPATIRNIMSDLEELGLVASPHTSAGRIPTPRGYRLFVDSLLTVQAIDESAVESRLHAGVSSHKTIASAAQVLSQLSQFAGVVLAPRREGTFQQIEFLRLSEKRILLVIVAPNGDVQNRLLLTNKDYTPSELVQAANYINQHYAGLPFDEVRLKLNEELRRLRDDITQLMQAAVEAGSDDPAVAKGEGGGSVPRFVQAFVVFVKPADVLGKVIFRTESRRHQHKHGLERTAPGDGEKLEGVIKAGGVATTRLDDGVE